MDSHPTQQTSEITQQKIVGNACNKQYISELRETTLLQPTFSWGEWENLEVSSKRQSTIRHWCHQLQLTWNDRRHNLNSYTCSLLTCSQDNEYRSKNLWRKKHFIMSQQEINKGLSVRWWAPCRNTATD